MIVYIVGVPGAGKTYYAVDKIYEFVKSDKYQFIYTNIDQFDFNFTSKVKKFDYEVFYSNVNDLYIMYKDKEKTDDDLIQFVKDLGYYKSLFIIDESHNYFDSLNPVNVWLFSYHRHIFLDFYLITQNLALIETKYKKFAEYFVRAVPTSLQLFNNTFKYKKFIDSRMSAKSLAGVEKIKKTKEVFDLYHSGDTVKAPNIIKKYLLWFLIGSVFVFIIFKLVINFIGGGDNVKVSQRDKVSISSYKSSSSKQGHRSVHKQGQREKELSDDSIKYYYLNCFSNNCYFKGVNKGFNMLSISALIKEFSCQQIFKNKDNSSVSYLLKCKSMDSFLTLFKESKNKFGVKKYEDSSDSITSSFINHSK